MSYLSTSYGELFYKEYGEGEPIIFLNGMAMSTNSWSPFIRDVAKKNKMIAIDLIDQGKAYGFDGEYTIETQSDALKEVLDALNMDRGHIVGISYGGQVALSFTLKYMNKVKSLTLINTSADTSTHIRKLIKGWIDAAKTLNGEYFSSIMLKSMYSKRYYKENCNKIIELQEYFKKKLDEDYYDKLLRTYNSSLDFNVIHKLNKIKIPTLIITSEEDYVIPKKFQMDLHRQIVNSKVNIFKDCGHGIIYEKPQEFIKTLLNFVHSS